MSDQLTCSLCAQSVAHTLIPHLRDEHKIEPEVFRARVPEQALCTDSFAGFLAERSVRKIGTVLNYQLEVAGCPMTARYGVDHPLIPEPDPTFVWTDPARDVAEATEHNERVFLYGPSGTGKSSLVREIAATVKRPVRRVSLNGETSVADFIGHWTVNQSKETVFVKGILPQAIQEGYILQMDEVDAMQPEVGSSCSRSWSLKATCCSPTPARTSPRTLTSAWSPPPTRWASAQIPASTPLGLMS